VHLDEKRTDACVEIGGCRIVGDTVPELYKAVLEHLVNEHKERLESVLPFKTSSRRYLVSRQPIHPSEKNFFTYVEYKDFYMETNKGYPASMTDLEKLVKKLDLTLQWVRRFR
jgi:hypothetical protein